MNNENEIIKIREQFKWDFKRMKNFLYKVDDKLFCIGGGVCLCLDDDELNELHNEYSQKADSIDINNCRDKNYDFSKCFSLFSTFEEILFKLKDKKGEDGLDIICNLIFENEDIKKSINEQKQKFLSTIIAMTSYEIDLLN